MSQGHFTKEWIAAADMLRKGAVGVMPTDTLYGIVCSALNEQAVERVYRVRGRNEHKPCIILISEPSSLAQFSVSLGGGLKKILARVWPGAVSVILDCRDKHFSYLHRGTQTLAFRVPGDNVLRDFLEKSGPLVAPSANPEGKMPARTIDEARAYFGDKIDFYMDGGECTGTSSTLVKYEDGELIVLREGAVRV